MIQLNELEALNSAVDGQDTLAGTGSVAFAFQAYTIALIELAINACWLLSLSLSLLVLSLTTHFPLEETL